MRAEIQKAAVEQPVDGLPRLTVLGEAQFEIPADWGRRRVVLNFGAVDWETRVWVNGQPVGTHRGGYDAFAFDITRALESKPAARARCSRARFRSRSRTT